MADIMDFLEHHGVKGQKWGVRRKTSGGRARKSPVMPKAKDLSDEQLRAAINRMQMEKQYTSLTKGKSTKTADLLKNVATTTVKGAVAAIATQQVNAALKKHKVLK